MELTELSQRINLIFHMPAASMDAEAKRRRLALLLPDLVELTASPDYIDDTKRSLLTKALRSLDPTAERFDDPESALEALRALLEQESGPDAMRAASA